MSSTQKKLQQAITKAAKTVQLDADFEYTYSNDGWVYFRRGLQTLANMDFHFQSTYATFAFEKGGAVRAQYHGNPHKRWYVEYHESTKLQEFIDQLGDLLKEVGKV